MTIIQNPRQYKIPDWFLNRQKDIKDGKFTQVNNPPIMCFSKVIDVAFSEFALKTKTWLK